MPHNSKSIILVVDDEIISRYTVEALLTSEGYTLIFAENGEEALKKAVALVPDLMLLDVMMPGMNGFEVCQQLRANPRLAELPVVMVTALDDRESRLRGLEVGADDFMSKPFDRAELRARIRTITRLNRYRRLVETEEQLVYLANYDTLTGLPNRNLLVERMRQTLGRASRNDLGVALLTLNLDGFQVINDSLGHDAGDRMLCEVAQRLTKAVSAGATVTRLGGDEFAVITEESGHLVKEISNIAQYVLKCVSEPMTFNNHEIVITTSIGISVYPTDGDDASILLKHARTALSRAKTEGKKNTYQFFTEEMNSVALKRLVLDHLRKALDRQELHLYYQPQIDLSTGRIVGMEALLRWKNPELGFVSPLQFISIAEETGLIIPIGEWVLRTACQQTQAWQHAGLPKIRVSVNVSGKQFQHPHLLQIIQDILRDSQLEPIYLELELTESILMDEDRLRKDNVLDVLCHLRNMGIHLAIDDFGTGYSSLSYLKRFPLSTLKIDKSFVQDVCTNKDDAAITTAIIAMAHSLELIIIAEGIEEVDQLEFLHHRGCEIGQGYLFGKPLPVEDMTKFLQQLSQQPFPLHYLSPS